jgi:hypothetical protein
LIEGILLRLTVGAVESQIDDAQSGTEAVPLIEDLLLRFTLEAIEAVPLIEERLLRFTVEAVESKKDDEQSGEEAVSLIEASIGIVSSLNFLF